VPDKDEMSRFWKKLVRQYASEVAKVVDRAVQEVRKQLPDLGEQLGTDTTAIRTWAHGRRDPSRSADPEADWGHKTRRWVDAEGKEHVEQTRWFGYKAKLLVDTRHELPPRARGGVW